MDREPALRSGARFSALDSDASRHPHATGDQDNSHAAQEHASHRDEGAGKARCIEASQGARMTHGIAMTMPTAQKLVPDERHAEGRGYTAPVTSKKGVIGIGLPKHLCDESRSYPAGSAALSFVPPVLAARWAGASPAGSRKRCPVVQPVELPPPFGLGSGGFCKPHLLEAIHG